MGSNARHLGAFSTAHGSERARIPLHDFTRHTRGISSKAVPEQIRAFDCPRPTSLEYSCLIRSAYDPLSGIRHVLVKNSYSAASITLRRKP
jgi:hypothetical protein